MSDTKGTTTDPVYKAMELLPLGPVMIIDTPGFDDEGAWGKCAFSGRSRSSTRRTLPSSSSTGQKAEGCDEELLALFKEKNIPYITVYNKKDLLEACPPAGDHDIYVSAVTKDGIFELKEQMARLKPVGEDTPIIGDLLTAGDFVVLVVPIDTAAPKGRLILPQQQTIREILDANCTAVVVKENALAKTLEELGKAPRMVVTDSQVFGEVAAVVPDE